MSNTVQMPQPTLPRSRHQPTVEVRRAAPDRRRLIRPLLVSDSVADAESYVEELQRAHFAVLAHVARDAREFSAQLRSQPCDVVVSADALCKWTGMQALELLREHDREVPFILVTANADEETLNEYLLNGATDCVDKNRPNLLPLAVALAVQERTLRAERNRAEQELFCSQALYRALTENPTFGICRVDENGRLLDANQALVAMLGYASRDELLAASLATDLIPDPAERTRLLEAYRRMGRVDGLEVDCSRKDGTPVKVRLGGRRVHDQAAVLDGCELIVENITAQRALEDRLRHLAATDPMTGLANYRRLTEAVDAEIKRSERTGRAFALLLFDLDGMKQINDRDGHLTGDRALHRVADAFRLLCRSVDTPARYGGDEFAIVLPETGVREARTVGRRICEHLARDPEAPRVSTSMGVASYPRDGVTIDHLLLTADRALYKMKRPRGESVQGIGFGGSSLSAAVTARQPSGWPGGQ